MSVISNISPPEVGDPLQEFTNRRGLVPLIEAARGIAEQCFVQAAPIVVRKVEDPESDDEWLEMRVLARGELPEVSKAHDEYTRQWLKSVPADQALMIRLVIRIA